MPQLDFTTFIPQLFWLFLCLSFLYIVLSKIALPRISDVIEERNDTITDDLDEAKALSLEAEKVVDELKSKLEDARSSSQKKLMDERQKSLDIVSSERKKFEEKTKNKADRFLSLISFIFEFRFGLFASIRAFSFCSI